MDAICEMPVIARLIINLIINDDPNATTELTLLINFLKILGIEKLKTFRSQYFVSLAKLFNFDKKSIWKIAN